MLTSLWTSEGRGRPAGCASGRRRYRPFLWLFHNLKNKHHKSRIIHLDLLSPSTPAVNQVVHRRKPGFLKKRSDMHIVPNAEIAVVLFLQCRNVLVVTRVPERSVRIPCPITPHSCCVFGHIHHPLSLPNVQLSICTISVKKIKVLDDNVMGHKKSLTKT